MSDGNNSLSTNVWGWHLCVFSNRKAVSLFSTNYPWWDNSGQEIGTFLPTTDWMCSIFLVVFVQKIQLEKVLQGDLLCCQGFRLSGSWCEVRKSCVSRCTVHNALPTEAFLWPTNYDPDDHRVPKKRHYKPEGPLGCCKRQMSLFLLGRSGQQRWHPPWQRDSGFHPAQSGLAKLSKQLPLARKTEIWKKREKEMYAQVLCKRPLHL